MSTRMQLPQYCIYSNIVIAFNVHFENINILYLLVLFVVFGEKIDILDLHAFLKFLKTSYQCLLFLLSRINLSSRFFLISTSFLPDFFSW